MNILESNVDVKASHGWQQSGMQIDDVHFLQSFQALRNSDAVEYFKVIQRRPAHGCSEPFTPNKNIHKQTIRKFLFGKCLLETR